MRAVEAATRGRFLCGAGVERVTEVLREEPLIIDDVQLPDFPGVREGIVFEDVCFSYDQLGDGCKNGVKSKIADSNPIVEFGSSVPLVAITVVPLPVTTLTVAMSNSSSTSRKWLKLRQAEPARLSFGMEKYILWPSWVCQNSKGYYQAIRHFV